jgi:ABC-type microcin C transport system permease subunit YejE
MHVYYHSSTFWRDGMCAWLCASMGEELSRFRTRQVIYYSFYFILFHFPASLLSEVVVRDPTLWPSKLNQGHLVPLSRITRGMGQRHPPIRLIWDFIYSRLVLWNHMRDSSKQLTTIFWRERVLEKLDLEMDRRVIPLKFLENRL